MSAIQNTSEKVTSSDIQNSSESKFENAPVTSSELRLVSEGRAVWELKNWSDPSSFEVLKKHANCIVKLSDGSSFRFFLKEQKINFDQEGTPPGHKSQSTYSYECISLFVKELIANSQLQKNYSDEGFNLKVAIQHLNDEKKPTQGPFHYKPLPNGQYWTSLNVSFEGGRKVSEERIVINDFIRLSSTQVPNPASYNHDPIAIAQASKTYGNSPTVFERPKNLRYGITVQLFKCDVSSSSSSSSTNTLEKPEHGEDPPAPTCSKTQNPEHSYGNYVEY